MKTVTALATLRRLQEIVGMSKITLVARLEARLLVKAAIEASRRDISERAELRSVLTEMAEGDAFVAREQAVTLLRRLRAEAACAS